ncbi:antifreeze protein [Marinovum sp. 2_MG-2023]|uniref:antifreeze protein n=1 Tax=unclassified Marinovum TaxID=2647166 RepID=UPI0026E2CE52|nr:MULTISPECIES: antifreeze protein [unclassified Marinovum]MDO6728520.1 antifreeze protein [Marinovum sp. 2_MG-2023]MDO6778064.1 antifreeze protein [Marinovum sp. 1_MG-2023]
MRVSLQHALETWKTCLDVGSLSAQAQNVITYRSLGMFGGWSVADDEDQRMITEKPMAFFKANIAAIRALQDGQRADQVTQAWIAPLADVVGSNHTRLQNSGPSGPGAMFTISR